jgi:hypothetical protein
VCLEHRYAHSGNSPNEERHAVSQIDPPSYLAMLEEILHDTALQPPGTKI